MGILQQMSSGGKNQSPIDNDPYTQNQSQDEDAVKLLEQYHPLRHSRSRSFTRISLQTE